MKYLITISYDGSKFYGFQRLNEKRTVQKELEEALSIINKGKVEIKGAGRTDKGVHSYGQRACFRLDVNVPEKRIINAINSLIGNDIRVTDCCLVDDRFHPRFDVVEKEYVYKINTGKYDPLLYNYMLFVDKFLDINKLIDASKLFIGEHDYTNFVAGTRDNSVAIVKDIVITKEDDVVLIKFVGKSFYRYMVRNLVGAMLDYAYDRVSLDNIKIALDNPNISRSFMCASPRGLYLMKIKYPDIDNK